MSAVIGQSTSAAEQNAPRPGETELEYFWRVVREAEEAKVARFLDWNREQLLRGRS